MPFFRVAFFLFLVGSISLFSCKREAEVLDTSPAKGLAFTDDTLYFDTVFTTMKTVTFRLRVYNENDKAINLKSVYVNGVNGTFPFTFHINGRYGPTRINDVKIEGKDSVYVLVSAQFDAKDQDMPFIISDDLVFEMEGRSQKQSVNLKAYGQDAYYYRNTALACNTVWKKDRPIILLDTVSIPRGCTLTVEPGARIYGYNAAFLIVRGTLICVGEKEPEKQIIWKGTRLEKYYDDVPGQWGGILIMDGSSNNRISYTTVKNSYRGIQVGEVGPFAAGLSPASLLLDHCYIQNIVDYGILGLKSGIVAVNNQIADCGQSAVYLALGGAYELYHNTVGLSGNNNYQRELPQVVLADYFGEYINPLYLKAVNNIISGSEDNEIGFADRPGADELFDTLFYHNLLKSDQDFLFKTSDRKKGNQKIQSGFRFKNAPAYNFRPDSLKFVQPFEFGISLDTVTSRIMDVNQLKDLLKDDILGTPRSITPGSKPDAGAYQR